MEDGVLKRSVVVAVLSVVLLAPAAFAGVVKKSESDICHSPESPHYSRTKNFQAFDSVQGCLNSGGRLPKSTTASLGGQGAGYQSTGYDRSQFGNGWADLDGDCQDSRAEALIAQSTTKVRFADERRCRVVTGRWISMYSGKVIQNAGKVDIDHVVPLKWAWDHGSDKWSRAERQKFANDPVNLVPAEASLNWQKGAQGPEDWLPPAGRCQYVSRFMRIVKVYRLQLSPGEANGYRQLLVDYCG